jgi:hypothetical protein
LRPFYLLTYLELTRRIDRQCVGRFYRKGFSRHARPSADRKYQISGHNQ